MVEKNIFWVLIRQKVKMYKWPRWHDIVTIQTWPKHFHGLYAFREFEIFINDEKIGECSTTWMILDGKSRRPIKTDFLNELINPREDYFLDFAADKVNVSGEFSQSKKFPIFA